MIATTTLAIIYWLVFIWAAMKHKDWLLIYFLGGPVLLSIIGAIERHLI